jgi:hypothetical protein
VGLQLLPWRGWEGGQQRAVAVVQGRSLRGKGRVADLYLEGGMMPAGGVEVGQWGCVAAPQWHTVVGMRSPDHVDTAQPRLLSHGMCCFWFR